MDLKDIPLYGTQRTFYNCGKCNRLFFAQVKFGQVRGRLPFLLHCSHVLCEDCINFMIKIKIVTCSVCGYETELNTSEKSAGQLFPTDRFILGSILKNFLYEKDNPQNRNQQFIPAGSPVQKYHNNHNKKMNNRPIVVEASTFVDSVSHNNITEHPPCTEYPSCTNSADWRCIDCNDLYCETCNIKVHNAAKAFRKHIRMPVGSLDLKDFSLFCIEHSSAIANYYCETCTQSLCWKCIVTHNNHQFQSILEQNKNEMEVLQSELINAKDMLRRIRYEQKKIQKEMEYRTNHRINPVEHSILKFFSNFHSVLQMLQNKVMDQFTNMQKESLNDLQFLFNDLEMVAKELTSVISICDLAEQNDYSEKLVLRKVTVKLLELLDSPCLLQGTKTRVENTEFVSSENITEIIEKSFDLRLIESQDVFRLISRTDFPEGIDLAPTEEELASVSVPDTRTRPVFSRTNSTSSESSNFNKPGPSSARKKLPCATSVENPLPIVTQRPKEIKPEDIVLLPGSSETVYVTHIIHPLHFYIQLTKLNKHLNALNQRVNHYALSAPIPDQPEINHHYLVQYTNKEYKSWYRGLVKDIVKTNSENLYEVFFIDYGNSAMVRKTDLRQINPTLIRDAPYAYQCKILNVYPKEDDWNEEAVKFMVQFVSGTENTDITQDNLNPFCLRSKRIQMLVAENSGGCLTVDLMDGDHSSLKFALVFVGTANTSSSKTNWNNSTYKRSMMMKKILPFNNFRNEQICDIVISNICDPHNFHIQLFENLQALQELQSRMILYYKKNYKKDFIYEPEKGMACAYSCPDNTWRRAEITNIIGDGKAEIYSVDYGQVLVVKWDKIRKLQEEFYALDAQAVKVRLHQIAPVKSEIWPDTACAYFSEYVTNKLLRMLIMEKNDDLSITLYEVKDECDICINALLVKENYAVSTGESSLLVEYYKTIPIEQRKVVKYNTCLDQIPSISTIPRRIVHKKSIKSPQEEQIRYRKMVQILKIESPSCFYVTCPEWVPIRHKLTRDLKTFYGSKECNPIIWKQNDKCAALSQKQNAWYRAIVLNVSNNTCTVFLKDIAFQEVLPLNNIHPLDAQFLQERDLAIRCSLGGLNPAGGTDKWTQIAIERFQEVVGQYREFYITKQSEIIDKTVPVNLYVQWEEDCGPLEPSKTKNALINKILIDQGVALPSKGNVENFQPIEFESDPFLNPPSSPIDDEVEDIPTSWLPPLPFIDKRFKAKATYVDIDGYIYLHPITYENNLTQMKRLLNFNFLKTCPDSPHSWYSGQMCTAQYHYDKSYYRAIVQETLPNNLIKVQFIDYGNEEECSHDELRSDIMLIEEPAMATKCKLHNIQPATDDGKWPIALLDKIHATIVDEEIDVEVIDSYTRVDDQPIEIIILLQNVNINIQVMSTDWNQAAREKIKGEIIEDNDDIVLEGTVPDGDTSNDSINDWVSLANLEQQNEVKFNFVKLPKNCLSFEAVVINILDSETVIMEASVNAEEFQKTQKEFNDLLEEIDKFGSQQPVVFEPITGQACCAQWEEDNKWYRAEICSINNLDSGFIEVLFVDFGNVEMVPRENIRMLRKEWAEYPVQQFKCKIYGLKRTNKFSYEVMMKYLSQVLLDQRLLVIVKETEPVLKIIFLDLKGNDVVYRDGINNGMFTYYS